MTEFRVRRIYEAPSSNDGLRVLVDRLWPRGMSKVRAHLDLWEKELTPSRELRSAYHRSEITYEEFTQRYRRELKDSGAAETFVASLSANIVTLLTAVSDQERSHIPVLLAALKEAGGLQA
ncbi:hypothetical protein CATRI_01700 [Corynebacterium atrinae]|uniref:DUF488 domain-containing protein n=1 Tax=Corynebacterium atrinae TaxID=1336740 RepID=UPI0025B3B12B|nr:DUF488 family protein [Corynebacterium atrinae]WJY62449.1 hypothetical protein CATRI_01700 [Corynebacterium atrinae]